MGYLWTHLHNKFWRRKNILEIIASDKSSFRIVLVFSKHIMCTSGSLSSLLVSNSRLVFSWRSSHLYLPVHHYRRYKRQRLATLMQHEKLLAVFMWPFTSNNGVFSTWSRTFIEIVNSENLRNHWGMNWVQCKDLLCCLWLCGWVVESLSLTQEILGSNPAIFIFDF